VVADVDLGVYNVAELHRAQIAGRAAGTVARVHLKADTGLSRGGSTPGGWPELCREAARAEADGEVRVVGLWSHFASSELGPDHPTNVLQRKVFGEALDLAADAGLTPEVRHLANSGALLTDPQTHYDLVRAGAALYGLRPVPGVDFGLRPVMSLHSHVALVKRVPAGSGVSYGHRYTTDRETTLALVPLGYGDGIPRAATNAASVLLGGALRTVAGTVAMDQFVVDVGEDEVRAGDPVLLFGPGGPSAGDWADAVGSIDYEIVTRVGARVPREYLGGPR
jgi:alanine racemase